MLKGIREGRIVLSRPHIDVGHRPRTGERIEFGGFLLRFDGFLTAIERRGGDWLSWIAHLRIWI
jgi:hypothetical protein